MDMHTLVAEPTYALEQLRHDVSGTLLLPGDSRYEQTRRGWNLSSDQRPALILVANCAHDVAAGVRYARAHGLGVAVQSTGHGMLHSAHDNLLIVTSRMTYVEIDPELRSAYVEAGVIWKQVLNAAADYGLAPLLGSSPDVGVVGYTLGGGMGWLARKYGLSADNVRSIDIVTPDGEMRRASATENSDLFWGLRGGGGNFGVVTAMEINLFPVATIYGGELVYPAELAVEALRFFRDWIKTLPDELTPSIEIMKYPLLPQLPEAVRGKTLLYVKAAYVGAPADGAALMQPWLDWHAPLSNTLREMPFTQVGKISNDPVDPMPSYTTGEILDDLSDDAIDVFVRYTTSAGSPLIFNEIRYGGGAIARVDPTLNAIGNRDARLYLHIGGVTPTPEARTFMLHYVQQFKRDLAPYLHGGMYLNFMNGSEAHLRTRDAYSVETFERLTALKAKYDPDNLFRFSFPIPALVAGEA